MLLPGKREEKKCVLINYLADIQCSFLCFLRNVCVVPEWKNKKKISKRIFHVSEQRGEKIQNCFGRCVCLCLWNVFVMIPSPPVPREFLYIFAFCCSLCYRERSKRAETKTKKKKEKKISNHFLVPIHLWASNYTQCEPARPYTMITSIQTWSLFASFIQPSSPSKGKINHLNSAFVVFLLPERVFFSFHFLCLLRPNLPTRGDEQWRVRVIFNY